MESKSRRLCSQKSIHTQEQSGSLNVRNRTIYRRDNFCSPHATGEVLLFLNNDTEIITPDWLERLVEHAIRPEVGAVGAKLYYPDGTIQHAGVIIGLRSIAGYCFRAFSANNSGYMGRLKIIQNLSAVTAACLITRSEVFHDVGGFDESYELALMMPDLCLNIRQIKLSDCMDPQYAECLSTRYKKHEGVICPG
jgi:hypothetical protein